MIKSIMDVPAPAFTDRKAAWIWLEQNGYVYLGAGVYRFTVDIDPDTAPMDYTDHYRVVFRQGRWRLRRQRFFADGSVEAIMPETLPALIASDAPACAGAPDADRGERSNE